MSPIGVIQFLTITSRTVMTQLGVGLSSFLLGSRHFTPAGHEEAGEDAAWHDSCWGSREPSLGKEAPELVLCHLYWFPLY